MKKTIVFVLSLAGGLLFFRFLLPPLLPFLLASCFAALLEPWVRRLCRRLRLRRAFAAFALTTLVLTLSFFLLGALLFRLTSQLWSWSESLPAFIETLPALWNGLLDRLDLWYSACPAFLRAALDALARQLTAQAPAIAGAVGERLVALASSAAAALPDVMLFLVTTILAIYFTTLSYPSILAFLKRQLPPPWQDRCRKAALCCRRTVLKWLRSELILICVTFSILLVGLTWMGIEYALLLAAAAALVDALPVLGAGALLLPWSLLSLLLGNSGQALALALLYAAVTITHTLLEPRLLAGQADLPPISALLAMYLGFRLFGIGGMLLLPLLLLLAKQLQDAGLLTLWK